jgi:D-alanyl-D-alanine dipeptidase
LLSYLVSVVFGLLLGNFATTVYYRLPRKIELLGFDSSINVPPMCSVCGARLRFYEYLPLLSWISTWGRCNYCSAKIDHNYFVLEVLSALTSIFIYHYFNFTDEYTILIIAFVTLYLQIALYKEYDLLSKETAISFMVLGVIFNLINEKSIFLIVVNITIAISIIIKIVPELRLKEIVFSTLSAATWCELYIFTCYVIILLLFYLVSVRVLKKMNLKEKKRYLYYFATAALIVAVFANYILPRFFDNDLFYREKKMGEGFVYLSEIAPSIRQDVKYATNDNFTGEIVPGYEAAIIIATKEAAEALAAVEQELNQEELGLKVFDCYRPERAIKSFKEWALSDSDNSIVKAKFYPNVEKKELLNGYISDKSNHNRGSTVDLTIIDLKTGEELNMGTIFDFLDPKSNFDHQNITLEEKSNREKLRVVMEKHGFEGYSMEWWHFQLKKEPFVNERFDFPVK